MTGETDLFGLPLNFALIVPGSSPKMKVKRWPSENFAYIANALISNKITPVLIGGQDELVFDGRSSIISNKGKILSSANYFKEEIFEWSDEKNYNPQFLSL